MVHGEKVMKLASPDNQIASSRPEGIAGSEPSACMISLAVKEAADRRGLIAEIRSSVNSGTPACR